MSAIDIPADRTKGHGGAAFNAGGAKLAETLTLWAGLTPGMRILDIGCGAGRAAIGIGERQSWQNDYVGLDVILKDIETCSAQITSRHPNFVFKHLDVRNGHYNPKGRFEPTEAEFPVADASFDRAFAFSLFTHMFDAETERYIQEAARVLKPGGIMLSTWFLIDADAQQGIEGGKADFAFTNVRADGTRVENALKPEDCVAHPLERIKQMFRDAGFTIEAFHRGSWPHILPRSAIRHRQDALACRRT